MYTCRFTVREKQVILGIGNKIAQIFRQRQNQHKNTKNLKLESYAINVSLKPNTNTKHRRNICLHIAEGRAPTHGIGARIVQIGQRRIMKRSIFLEDRHLANWIMNAKQKSPTELA